MRDTGLSPPDLNPAEGDGRGNEPDLAHVLLLLLGAVIAGVWLWSAWSGLGLLTAFSDRVPSADTRFRSAYMIWLPASFAFAVIFTTLRALFTRRFTLALTTLVLSVLALPLFFFVYNFI